MLPDVLNTIDLRTLGLELQAARKRKGMRQEDAAKIINVGRTTLTAIEKGERRITAAELVKLATAYDAQVSDFVRPRPIISPTVEQFRGPAELMSEDREEIEPYVARAIEYARTYVELEELRKAPLVRKYPTVYESRGPVQRVAEGIAIEERQRLALGDGPLPPLRDVFEQYVGLRIFYIGLPKKFAEIYFYDDVLGGCIVVNRKHPEERRRWSLVHGYLHFLAHRYHTDVTYDEELFRPSTPEERLAEAFTPHFLMPATGLKRRYNDMAQVKNGFSTADLLTLANMYAVSVQALTLRLEDLDLLPTGMWQSLKARKFPIQDYQEKLGLKSIEGNDDIFPMRYKLLALEALSEGQMDEEQFAYVLSSDRLNARVVVESITAQHRSNGDSGSDLHHSERLQ
jgi:Zn-dependent peptidase ImmA (M78 family)/DNA-binding XRE family transcriptional regulator